MANNRLEITLAAKVDEFRRDMKNSQQDLKDLAGQANKTSKEASEALSKLSTYLLHVRSQQPPVTAARDYVEED